MPENTNRLAGETSPYLLQHADNPVDWYPWGPEALDKARAEDKPILLSIGYSACHWCHVMAHESFEDPATARLMNELFVNVKVDREERPDLDRIYQLAHQMITQRGGGWPLTMFLAPSDQSPFFGGTYFPRTARHGLPGFKDLLTRVAGYWRDHRDEITSHGEAVKEAFGKIWDAPAATEGSEVPMILNDAPLVAAREELGQAFDSQHGGFGAAPKFPHPPSIVRLLRHWRETALGNDPDLEALYMVTFTLKRMASGGMFDQVGGGFSRYSVDERWMIPHFEKMLYDNGQLLALYAQAWAVTDEPLFRRIATDTARWVMREMQSPEGGYYSALDADSEGEEGRFYVWTPDEVRGLLSPAESAVFAPVYGLDREPNFEGRWHLHGFRPVAEVAEAAGISSEEAESRLASARRKLLVARDTRVRPGLDDKVLAAWNGLMIRGMAIAARTLGDDAIAESAHRAMAFVRDNMMVDGRLAATWKGGRARHAGYLDDYAFMLDAALEMLQLRWDPADLEFAVSMAETLLDHFEDKTNGGFYFTADDHEALIERPRPLADDAIPSGNGIAALALNRLGCLLGEPRYLASAEAAVRSAWPAMERAAFGHCALLDALDEQRRPPEVIIVRGSEGDEWARTARLLFAPRRLVFHVPGEVADLPEGMTDKVAPEEGTRAWICRGQVCWPPLDTLSALTEALKSGRA